MIEEKKVRRTYLLSAEAIEKLKKMAEQEKRKLSTIVETLIEQAYEKDYS